MPMTPLRSFLVSRRDWLRRSALPLALPSTTLLAQDSQANSAPGTEVDLAAAERLAGIEFTAAERRQAAPLVREHLAAFREMRKGALEWHLDPALRFDPLPPGAPLPTADGEPVWQPLAAPGEPSDETELAFASVQQLATWLRARKVTSVQLTDLALRRLATIGKDLLCVVTLLADEARAAAAQADAELLAGKDRGPLHGIPFGAKDLFAWPSAPTTFGAKPYRDQVWNATATVLAKLRDAGAVLVAKLSLGALAMGDLWFGGRTRNPWNKEQGSSGSSAGSAAAVAAGLVPFALGTETLGSIVSPCTRCGVTGLRTTFGTVSRFGAMPLSWSMDKIGPIARSAADCALVLAAIRGPDGKDASVRKAAFPWRRDASVQGLKIGFVSAGRASASLDALRAALRAAGAELVDLVLPPAPYRAMLVMLHAEGATAFDELTRDGGVRTLDGQGNDDWPNQFRAARFIPAVEYLRAARLRSRLVADMAKTMAEVDAFVALPFGGSSLTCTNLTGHPCIVMPLAAAGEGAPTSVTIVGKLYGEATLCAIAETWQRADRTHLRRPKV